MSKHKKPKPPTFEILADAEHPTVRVQAATWRHLLQASASALAQIELGEAAMDRPISGEMLTVELSRVDFDSLLEAWLNELLHLGRQHSMVFHTFEILQLDLESDCRLTATIEGSPASQDQTHVVHSVARPTPRPRNTGKRIECEIRFQPERSAP